MRYVIYNSETFMYASLGNPDNKKIISTNSCITNAWVCYDYNLAYYYLNNSRNFLIEDGWEIYEYIPASIKKIEWKDRK